MTKIIYSKANSCGFHFLSPFTAEFTFSFTFRQNSVFFSMGCAFVSVSLERTAGVLRTDCAYVLVGIIIYRRTGRKNIVEYHEGIYDCFLWSQLTLYCKIPQATQRMGTFLSNIYWWCFISHHMGS